MESYINYLDYIESESKRVVERTETLRSQKNEDFSSLYLTKVVDGLEYYRKKVVGIEYTYNTNLKVWSSNKN